MLGKVCHSTMGISKSKTTRLELGNIILSSIIILCVFVISLLGISRFNHGGTNFTVGGLHINHPTIFFLDPALSIMYILKNNGPNIEP